nr:reverse transcriptase domain-containing protein [Tanacetum cinerariifolium]
MEALTTRIDLQFKEIKGDMKEMRDRCKKCGGPHHQIAMINLWEDPRRKKQIMPPKDIEEIIMVEILEISAIVNHTIVMKIETQPSAAKDFVKNQFYNLKTKVEQGQKNHQAAIQDLKTKSGRISDHQSSRPTGTLPSNTQTNLKPSTSNDKPYQPSPTRNEHVNVVYTRSGKTYHPPANPNAKPAIFLDDSEDKDDEIEKEAKPLPNKPTHADPPPLKAYKPKFLTLHPYTKKR